MSSHTCKCPDNKILSSLLIFLPFIILLYALIDQIYWFLLFLVIATGYLVPHLYLDSRCSNTNCSMHIIGTKLFGKMPHTLGEKFVKFMGLILFPMLLLGLWVLWDRKIWATLFLLSSIGQFTTSYFARCPNCPNKRVWCPFYQKRVPQIHEQLQLLNIEIKEK